MSSGGSVYADQWKACADLMRQKAVEFDKLAEEAPIRPTPNDKAIKFLVESSSVLDLARGSNFPDEFVRDMAAILRDGRALVEQMLGRDS